MGREPEHTCEATIVGPFDTYKHGVKAKVERNGKWYCGTHDPVRIAERRAEREAELRAEEEAEMALRDASDALCDALYAYAIRSGLETLSWVAHSHWSASTRSYTGHLVVRADVLWRLLGESAP